MLSRLFADGYGPLQLVVLRATGHVQQAGEIAEAQSHIGMVRAKRFLAYRQSALEQRLSPGEIALGLKQNCEVVDALHRIRMFGPRA